MPLRPIAPHRQPPPAPIRPKPLVPLLQKIHTRNPHAKARLAFIIAALIIPHLALALYALCNL